MNLPNKITILRVIMIPFFVFFLLSPDIQGSKYIALVIYITASLTDLLDGYIARKNNLITNFGKFMDPLADKLLVCSALICLVEMQLVPAWVVLIIISREFIISGFRLVASNNSVVIAASMWGKFKTTAQMIMTILLIANIDLEIMQTVTQIFIYLSLILTVISLFDYMIKNIQVLKEGGNK